MREWTPRDISNCPPEKLADRLARWLRNPESEPEIEEWYMLGFQAGLPFAERKPTASELEHYQYFSSYEAARKLERAKRTDEALAVYLDILAKYTPHGTVYYERPAIILERQGRLQEAIWVCIKALKHIRSGDFKADPGEFEKRILRLTEKMRRRSSF